MVSKRKRSRRSAALRSNHGQRLFGDVLSMASTVAESRKHMFSERLSELASAAKVFSKTIDDLPYLRDYTDAAASGIDKLAAYVERTDVPDMVDDIASFARRQPVATLALGVVAGLIATQVLRNRPIFAGRPLSVRGRSSRSAERKRGRGERSVP